MAAVRGVALSAVNWTSMLTDALRDKQSGYTKIFTGGTILGWRYRPVYDSVFDRAGRTKCLTDEEEKRLVVERRPELSER